MTERWRPITGFAYDVSDHGRVRRIGGGRGAVVGRILKCPRSTDGYPSVVLSRSAVPYTRRVHALVMEAFVGSRPDGYLIDHIDHQRTNNRLSNLRYATRSENAARGEDNGMTSLTANDVRRIRRVVAPVLNEFGISVSCLADILLRRTWGHIE